jgi:hypothetical protein
MAQFLRGMFRHRRPAAPEPPAAPPPLPAEVRRQAAREAREAAEAAELEQRRRESTEEIAQACKQIGFWWPGEVTLERGRGLGGGDRTGVIARLFGGWRR